MTATSRNAHASNTSEGVQICITGQVQGVGFRPTVWKLAQQMDLVGNVANTASGVIINLWRADVDEFIERLKAALPNLASIDSISVSPSTPEAPSDFQILPSVDGDMRAEITPDAATCPDCIEETFDAFERRYRYPFTNCTNCGPRFSIISGAPYDREKTSMAAFSMCEDCRAEYEDPLDRRMHAQPIACHKCGPKAWIEKLGSGVVNSESFSMMDDVDAAGGMLMMGHIVAIKGIGGFHLSCDATNIEAVERLRKSKGRKDKAFALMAKSVEIIREYCEVNEEEEALLQDASAPIVVLKAKGKTLPDAVAPGLNRLGFMLPYTPLHHLMLRRMKRPVTMTSGNHSGAPQSIENDHARQHLADIADFACLHDRAIENRLDDSVARIDNGVIRILRRARGFVPQSFALPKGFENASDIFAFGGDYKNTYCMIKNGRVIVSQHHGDLDNPAVRDEVHKGHELYADLYEHEPKCIVIDKHPEFVSSTMGRRYAKKHNLPIVEVQHHHAHIASCMLENGYPLNGAKVLGIAFDGTGWGDDGTIWGGEFLACDYRSYERMAKLKPVALLGREQAVRQPWRNAYAQIMGQMGWAEFAMNFEDLEVFKYLNGKPRQALDAMLHSNDTQMTSSCGRLFDAAAALSGALREEQSYEGHAAMLFEASLDPEALNEHESLSYPFTIPIEAKSGMPYIEPLGVWRALLGDLIVGTPLGVISARFHRGLADVIARMAIKLAGEEGRFKTVALSGGCFQNKVLFELLEDRLSNAGFTVLSHSKFPANDGGLSLGQAAIAAACLIANSDQGETPCV